MEVSQGPSIEQKSKSTQASDRLREYRSIYEQLPVNESRTRVVVLHSHLSNAAPLSCSLEVMTLDPEPSRPYMALSYVWGDASETKDINVNDLSLAVTSNLASALWQIRKSFGEVLLWVDAISINQRDIPERNQQVLLMKKIYSKAERVIGWLGPDENGGSQALKTFEALFRNAIGYPDKFEWARRMPELLMPSKTCTIDSAKAYQSNDVLERLLLLVQRPFWRRMWIVQELVLPLNLRLMCADDFTDIPEPDPFYNTVSRLTKVPVGLPNFLPLHMMKRLTDCMALLRLVATLRFRHLQQVYKIDRIWQGVSGFIHARPLLIYHETSDPRDHVYALLGLFDLDIVPDYGEDVTVADVYLEAAQHCLKAKPLDILSLAGARHGHNGSDFLINLDAPSWVPDWRLPTPASVRVHRYPQSHAFPSNGGLQMQIIDYKWLRGPAVVWDTVQRTESKTGWDLTEWDLAENIDIEKPDDWAYPSGISRFEAMVMLWIGGHDGTKPSPCDLQLDSELFRSYETIFYANIAKPWANKHGRHEVPKLARLIFGGKGPKSVPYSHRETWVVRTRQLRYDMRCFHTERGYVGFGPLATEVGDLICILEGHKPPVLLRRRGSHYTFVGDCDVVGIMNGEVLEAVKRGEAEINEIEIR